MKFTKLPNSVKNALLILKDKINIPNMFIILIFQANTK